MDAVGPSLRNPASAKYHWATFPAVVTEGSVNYCATVDAQSPYAAYNGRQAFVVTAQMSSNRVSSAVDLKWDQVDFTKGHLHVRRLKNGINSVHPIQGDELRALRELRREQEPQSAFVFCSERGGPMTRSNVAKRIEVAGDRAGLPALPSPHAKAHSRASVGRRGP